MEDWALRNWCFQTVLLDKTLESPLEYKEIRLVNPEENQSWMFIGRTDAEAETPILWPTERRVNSLKKTLMLGKIEGRRRRRWQRMRWLDSIIDLVDMSWSKLRETVKDREAWHSRVPCGGRFLRSFLGQLCLKVIIPSRTCPGHLEKTREG